MKTGFLEFISVRTHAHMNAWVCICKHLQTEALCDQHICMSTHTQAHALIYTLSILLLSLFHCHIISYSHRLGSKAPWLIIFSSSEDLSWIHLCYSCRGGVSILYVLYVQVGKERQNLHSVCARVWRYVYINFSARKKYTYTCVRAYILWILNIHLCSNGHQMKNYLPMANYDLMSLDEWW